MASPGSTGGDFQSRVDKIFGSLAFSQQPPSSSSPSLQPPSRPSPLWSLKDGDVEKREWRRDQSSSYARDQTPCSSSFDDLVKQMQRNSRSAKKQTEDDLRDVGEEDDQIHGKDEDVDDDEDGDEWSIRSSIGLDPTLDNEEEEDEYDKVALGRENAGDRLYMKDITDQGTSMGSIGGPRKSLGRATRDPRANHLAAKLRLKEDEAETQTSSFCHDDIPEGKASPRKEPSKDVFQPKPILKRKDNSSEAKPSKRVRFDLGSRTDSDEVSRNFEDSSLSSANSSASERESPPPQNSSRIPDFLQNPSKYTRYSFDSSGVIDEKANSKAIFDLVRLFKGSKSEGGSCSDGVPVRITFTPKKTKGVKEEGNACEIKENSRDVKETDEDKKPVTCHQAVHSKGITAVLAQEGEVNTTEEDEAELGTTEGTPGLGKPSRQYRSKSRSDETDA